MILMAEDDEDDRLMAKEALDEANFANEIRFVEDGEHLMDYLCRRGEYSDPATSPRPELILLDLNMGLRSLCVSRHRYIKYLSRIRRPEAHFYGFFFHHVKP